MNYPVLHPDFRQDSFWQFVIACVIAMIIATLCLVLHITKAQGDIFDDYKTQIIEIERSEEIEYIIKNSPFLQLLDEFLDLTAGITFYKVKDKRTNEIYELYELPSYFSKKEGKIKKRKKMEDDDYWFMEINGDKWWRCKENTNCEEKIFRKEK